MVCVCVPQAGRKGIGTEVPEPNLTLEPLRTTVNKQRWGVQGDEVSGTQTAGDRDAIYGHQGVVAPILNLVEELGKPKCGKKCRQL